MKPLILLLARKDMVDGFVSYYIHEEYLEAILQNKGIPLVYTPTGPFTKEQKNRLFEVVKTCQGILLPGGTDVTREDLFLIDYAYRNKVPLLGICLGMQAMASYQNRKPLAIVNRDNTHASREKIVHSVILEESHLSHILQDKKIISVNSRHFECALSSRRFQVVGRSPDGVMEAIENADHPFQIGVQWHPESMIYADENSKKIFESFLEVARSFPSSSQ